MSVAKITDRVYVDAADKSNKPGTVIDTGLQRIAKAASENNKDALDTASAEFLSILANVTKSTETSVENVAPGDTQGGIEPKQETVIEASNVSADKPIEVGLGDPEQVVTGVKYGTIQQLFHTRVETKEPSKLDLTDLFLSSIKQSLTRDFVLPGRRYVSTADIPGALGSALSGVRNPLSTVLDGKWYPDAVTYGDVVNPAPAANSNGYQTVNKLNLYAEGIMSDSAVAASIGNNAQNLAKDQNSRIDISTISPGNPPLPNWGHQKNFAKLGVGSDFYWGLELGNPDITDKVKGETVTITCHAPRNPFLSANYNNWGFNSTNESPLLCYIPIAGYTLSDHMNGTMETLDFGDRVSIPIPSSFQYPTNISFSVYDTDIYIWERYLRQYYEIIYGGNGLGEGTVLPYKNCCSTIKLTVFYQTGQVYLSQKFYCIPDANISLKGDPDRAAKEHTLNWHIYGQSNLEVVKLDSNFNKMTSTLVI